MSAPRRSSAPAARNASGRHRAWARIFNSVVSGTPLPPPRFLSPATGTPAPAPGTQTSPFAVPEPPALPWSQRVSSGVSSPQTDSFVHQHIDSIQITSAETQPPQYDCFSQGQTWQFQGIALSNSQDITDTVGPLTGRSPITESSPRPPFVYRNPTKPALPGYRPPPSLPASPSFPPASPGPPARPFATPPA